MKRIFIYLVFLTIFKFSFAQYPNWQQYSAGDGVSCQAFENEETLWVGTTNGLFKLNTVTGEVETFNTANSPLTSNSIRSIVVDNNNNKWIGTRSHGLLMFDDNLWTVYDTANSGLPAMGISDMEIDSDGKIWMKVYSLGGVPGGAGIVCYDGYEWTFYNSQNSGLPGTSYSCIYLDNFEDVWIGCYYEGLVKFDGSDWIVFNEENSGIPNDHVHSLFIDSDNTKWVGTSDGLGRFDDINWTVFDTANSELPYPVIRCINKDENNTLWIGNYVYGTGGQCLATLQSDSIWTIYTTDNSGLPDNLITTINIYQNKKWVGTYNGIASFDNNEWETYELGCGLPDEKVTNIAVGNNDNKWVATSNGLSKFNGNEWVTYNSNNSQLPVDAINSIEVDSNNIVYVNTRGGGLVVINNDVWTVYNTTNSGLPDDNVYCCTFDKNGSIYIGTDNGFAIFIYNEWIVYDTVNSGLPYNQIRDIIIDYDSVVWLISGWNMRKVVSFDGSEWVIHTGENGLPLWSNVFSMAVDHDNIKWLGTNQWGIYSYDGTIWLFHPEIPTTHISDIQVDKNNTKWFGTSEGLAKYVSENNYYVYTEDNSGLSGKMIYSLAIDNNNTIWCGTRFNGISAFNENGFAAIRGNSINERIDVVNSFPNPFVSETTIQISLQRESEVFVTIYSLSGEFIALIYEGRMKTGLNSLTWNGKDNLGNVVNSGVYIISLSIDNREISAKRIIKL